LKDDNELKVLVSENDKLLSSDFKKLTKKLMRSQIINDGKRVDGRDLDEVRKISASAGILPKRVHGSALFQRGLTQVLSTTTLGTPSDAQEMDDLNPSTEKTYLHHYNFPPYSVGETRPMRNKEEAHDYRYFPDPDLLPLEVSDEFVNKLKSEIPELPDDKKKRFINEFKLSAYEATILVSDIEIAKYFEEVVAKMGKNKDMKLAVNWITGELFAVLNSKNLEITQSPVSAKNLAILVNLIKNGTISGKIAKTVFELMLKNDEDPQKIVEEKGLKQQSDPKALEELIDKIINNNREKAIEYKQGKEKLFGFFVGQAMKASGGKANPQLINEILKKKL